MFILSNSDSTNFIYTQNILTHVSKHTFFINGWIGRQQEKDRLIDRQVSTTKHLTPFYKTHNIQIWGYFDE